MLRLESKMYLFVISDLTVTAIILYLNFFKDAFEYYMFHFAYYIVHQETNRVSYVHGLSEYLLHLIKPSGPGCSNHDEA